jgi:hypothetical protein
MYNGTLNRYEDLQQLAGKPEGKSHIGNIGAYGWIILKRILHKTIRECGLCSCEYG